MPPERPLYVTRPALPPLEEVLPLLEEIWNSRILTNEGPCHERFESALADHLGVDHLCLVSNATLGLVLALRHAVPPGEVITTPFSFVGTSHALAWCGLEPVFADIDPRTLNLDPDRVEAAITPRTTGIMPVHCFGHGCDTAALADIARRHKLRIVYDAAHAFGVDDEGGSILRHGDLSVISMHATKVFNTFEGGAVICADEATRMALVRLRNFGIIDEKTVDSIGLNAKMNEFNAAVGLVQLRHVSRFLEARARVDDRYRELLADTPGIRPLDRPPGQTCNYYNFPVLVEPSHPRSRDEVMQRLRDAGIYARHYFHPLISDLPMYRGLASANPAHLPVARDISARILCLPMFPDLTTSEQQRVVEVLRS